MHQSIKRMEEMNCSLGGKKLRKSECLYAPENSVSTLDWSEGELAGLWGSGSSLHFYCAELFSACFGYMRR